MSKRNFKATEGLLHDVMRKQAGTVEKSILEAIMNSVDAGASSVRVEIHEEWMDIYDDGKGMSKGEVESYFEQFGLKDDDIDSKQFGKFRMGRGQIFNFGTNVWHTNDNYLIVNLNEDETTIEIEGEEMTFDTEGLSYNLVEGDEHKDGTHIEVLFYDPLDNPKKVGDEAIKLARFISWLHDVDITINGEVVDEELEYDYETDHAYYKIGSDGWRINTEIYNQGAFVKNDSLTKTGGIIVTKDDLDVNFARNDILETCKVWDVVEEEYKQKTVDFILEQDEPEKAERKWLLEQAVGNDQLYKRIKDMPLIDSVTGETFALTELMGQRVTFTNMGNRLADSVAQQGNVKVIDQSFKRAIHDLIDSSNVVSFTEAAEKEAKWVRRELDETDLSARRTKNLNNLRDFLEVLGSKKDVKPGYSDQDSFWVNSEGSLFVHKEVLNETKSEFYPDRYIESMKYAAQSGDTANGLEDGYEELRKLWRFNDDLATALQKVE